MSCHRYHRRACGPGRSRRRGPIKRVVRGLAGRFGVPRGLVIAGFVLGFVFVPLLTVLLFLAALYWVDHPEQGERHAARAAGWGRDVLARLAAALRGHPAPGSDPAEAAAAAREIGLLGARFAALERRARAIEEYVASEEFRLEREFRRMGRHGSA